MKLLKYFLFIGAIISSEVHADMNTYASNMAKYKNYMMPIKVSNDDQFLYVFSLLLDKESMSGMSPYPIHMRDDLIQLKLRCDTVGAMLSSRDFLKLNKEFATNSMIKDYENNEQLNNLIKELGNSCTSIPKIKTPI